jgi:hypothetical protein
MVLLPSMNPARLHSLPPRLLASLWSRPSQPHLAVSAKSLSMG